MGNTAAIYVRRSSADERNAYDSDRTWCGLPGAGHIVQNPTSGGGMSADWDSPL